MADGDRAGPGERAVVDVSVLTPTELVARRRVATGMTKRSPLLLAGLALAAAGPAGAVAHESGATATASRAKTKVFVATLKPVRADIGNYSATAGRARIHTNARNRRARATLRATALFPRRTYRWAITARRCGGPRLAGWTFKRLRADRRGRGRATGSARRFVLPRRARRYVVLFQPGTRQPLICGRIKRKA